MNAEAIYRLCKEMGVENVKEKSNGWVTMSCPFASKRHKNGRDKHPSFGISIGDVSFYNCFACGISGEIKRLPYALTQILGENHMHLMDIILENQGFNTMPQEKMKSYIKPIPESFLNKNFSKMLFTWKYITPQMAERHGILYDRKRDMIVFTIYDRHLNLISIKGRGRVDRVFYTYKNEFPDNSNFKFKGIWYGINDKLNNQKPLFIVEGERDRLLLKEAGVENVWASFGAATSFRQREVLKKVRTNGIVLFTDNDKAGRLAKKQLAKELCGLHKVYEVSDYLGHKDPASLCEQKMVHEALKTINLMEAYYE